MRQAVLKAQIGRPAKSHILCIGGYDLNRWLKIASGLFGNWLITQCFDYLLYPFVIWKFHTLTAISIMWSLSFVVCYLCLIAYDAVKIDFLGVEMIKKLRDTPQEGFLRRAIQWFLRKGNVATFFYLSIKFDPFIVVIYMRKGINEFNGLTASDWCIFLLSSIVANVYWTLIVLSGITMTKLLFQF